MPQTVSRRTFLGRPSEPAAVGLHVVKCELDAALPRTQYVHGNPT